MSFVFDSTALIYFAKLRLLDKIAGIEAGIVPSLVYEEVVVEGKKSGKEDALFVERLVDEGRLKLAALKDKKLVSLLSKIPGMSLADAEVLALAKELSAVAVIDEAVSRAVAEAEGISFHGTVFLLFLLSKKKMISSLGSYPAPLGRNDFPVKDQRPNDYHTPPLAVVGSLISKKDIKTYVDKMIGLGWRCSTEFYAAILDEIGKL